MARNVKTKQISVARGFGKDGADALVAAYDHYKGEDTEIAIHCRIGTSGIKDIRNTHPFEIHNGLWLMHNGVIDIDRASDVNYCDTYHFAKGLESWAGDGNAILTLLKEEQNTEIIKGFIGGSKLLFLEAEHGFFIVNEGRGEWKNGLWYSNDSLWMDWTWAGSTKVTRANSIFAGNVSVEDEDESERAYWENFGERTSDYFDVVPRSERIKGRKAELRNMGKVLQSVEWVRKLSVDQIADECLDSPEEIAELVYALMHGETEGMRLHNVRLAHQQQFFTDLCNAKYGTKSRKASSKVTSIAPKAPAVTPAIEAVAKTFNATPAAVVVDHATVSATKGGE